MTQGHTSNFSVISAQRTQEGHHDTGLEIAAQGKHKGPGPRSGHGPGPHGGRHTKGGGGGSAADSEVIRPLGGVFGAVDAKVSVGLRPAPQRAQITIAASRNDA